MDKNITLSVKKCRQLSYIPLEGNNKPQCYALQLTAVDVVFVFTLVLAVVVNLFALYSLWKGVL
jgi:hypothetical protein